MLLYRFVWFLFVHPSVLSSVLPSCRRSFSLNANFYVWCMYACPWYSLFLTSNFLLRTSVFILGWVCLRTRACGRCVHAYEQSVCPCIHPVDLFVFNLHVYVWIFLSACKSDAMFVCPSVYLTAYMHAYVEVCASVHSSVHPFVCIHECFILACVRECLWAWV